MNGIYYIKPVDNSRWMPAANPRERHYYATLMLGGAALLVAGMLFAGERFKSREYGYQIERMEREKTALLESSRKLQLEQALLRAWISMTRASLGALMSSVRRGELV